MLKRYRLNDHLEIDEDYYDYIEINREFMPLHALLIDLFLFHHPFMRFKKRLMLFRFPNEDYTEPMLKIITNNGSVDLLHIRKFIEKSIDTHVLLNYTDDTEQKQKIDSLMKRFRIIVRRD